MSILREIADKTRERIDIEKEGTELSILLQQIEERKENSLPEHAFLNALKGEGMSFICEVKKASPFEGLLNDKLSYTETAEKYEEAGASAVSCVTEPFFFQGSDQYLWEISGRIRIPVLRKDFVIDEYMVYQAKALGASAITLYCSVLDDEELKSFSSLSAELGMDTVFEVHDEPELLRAVNCGAGIIGIVNRDPETLEVDLGKTIRLQKSVPASAVVISDGGIRTSDEISMLYEGGCRAVLIGKTMMQSGDKKKTLKDLRGIYG